MTLTEIWKIFFRLHRLSRDEKAVFMTEDMADFFSSVIAELLPAGIAKLFFLEVAGVRAASALCFDYRNKRLLYNSGYDHAYAALSVGPSAEGVHHPRRGGGRSGHFRFSAGR